MKLLRTLELLVKNHRENIFSASHRWELGSGYNTNKKLTIFRIAAENKIENITVALYKGMVCPHPECSEQFYQEDKKGKSSKYKVKETK